MSKGAKTWIKRILKWGIAIAGIWYVVANLTLRDRVQAILDPKTNLPVVAVLASSAKEETQVFDVIDPGTGNTVQVSRDNVVNPPDAKKLKVKLPTGTEEEVPLLGLNLAGNLNQYPEVKGLLVKESKSGHGVWVAPADVVGGYKLKAPRPRVDVGLIRMVQEANPMLLWAAVLIIPLTHLITAYRWNELLKALDIRIGQWSTFKLTLVGAFYNTFMPGSTGGDFIKAYEVSKHTEYRTRAVMSVLIDRVIGLLGLIILGGVMATMQWHLADCRRVAIGCYVVVGLTILGCTVFYTPALRRGIGLDFIFSKLPMQKQVKSAVQTMEILGQRPGLALLALLVTFPVHMVVIISATFAGKAFGLPLSPGYYWVVVPVVVLVGAIPISPQGAGVMEVFAIHLTSKQGATVGQAVALTMSIRLVQLVWNLLAGIVVLKGGYHSPTEKEQNELDEGPPPSAPPATA